MRGNYSKSRAASDELQLALGGGLPELLTPPGLPLYLFYFPAALRAAETDPGSVGDYGRLFVLGGSVERG